MRDEGLLRKVADQIRAYPEGYDQSKWFYAGPQDVTSELVDRDFDCGSTGCVAGHIVSCADGFRGFISWVMWTDSLGRDKRSRSFTSAKVGERRGSVSAIAQEVAGLTDDDAERLFCTGWKPNGHDIMPLNEAVADALYKLADGATIEDVTDTGSFGWLGE